MQTDISLQRRFGLLQATALNMINMIGIGPFLGAASRVGVYDYLGYYDVCYIGDEEP